MRASACPRRATFVPSQNSGALVQGPAPPLHLRRASAPTVAFDFLPLPVRSRPLLPPGRGGCRNAGGRDGDHRARAASHPAIRSSRRARAIARLHWNTPVLWSCRTPGMRVAKRGGFCILSCRTSTRLGLWAGRAGVTRSTDGPGTTTVAPPLAFSARHTGPVVGDDRGHRAERRRDLLALVDRGGSRCLVVVPARDDARGSGRWPKRTGRRSHDRASPAARRCFVGTNTAGLRLVVSTTSDRSMGQIAPLAADGLLPTWDRL